MEAFARNSWTSSDKERISVRASPRKFRSSALSRFRASLSATSVSSKRVVSALSVCG